MGRMSELHLELQERGLTDEQIESRNLDDLNFDDCATSEPTDQWWAHQDVSSFADEYQAACIRADIDEWRMNAII